MEQINSKNNIVDGKQSDLLACIGLEGCHSFGSIHTVRFVKPEYKLLQNSTINEWKIVIKDEDNNILDNNSLSVYISIEINEYNIMDLIVMRWETNIDTSNIDLSSLDLLTMQKSYVNAQDNLKVNKSGDRMSETLIWVIIYSKSC